MKKLKKVLMVPTSFSEVVIYSLVLIFLLLRSVGVLRRAVPPAMVGSDGIVGSAHFLGQSLGQDFYVFVLASLVPLIVAVVVSARDKYIFGKRREIGKAESLEKRAPRNWVELGGVFVATYAVTSLYFVNVCKRVLRLGFDSQNSILWDYASTKGYLPFREIFTPYGLLFYYKASSLLAHSTYLLIVPVLYTALFWVFKQIFGHLRYVVPIFILFLVVVHPLFKVLQFSRYGWLVVWASVFPLLLWRVRKNKVFGLVGVLLGLVLGLFIGEGLYLIAFTYIALALDSLYRRVQGSIDWRVAGLKFFWLTGGLGLSLVVLAAYLLDRGILDEWLGMIRQFSYMSVYAKTQFNHVFVWEQAVSFGAFFVILFVLVYKLFFSKQKLGQVGYVQASVLLGMFLLQQKNIMRPVGTVLLPFALMLMFTFVADAMEFAKKHRVNQALAYIVTMVGIGVVFNRFDLYGSVGEIVIDAYQAPGRLGQLYQQPEEMLCKAGDFAPDKLPITSGHQRVYTKLVEIEPEPKIISYPYDPIFYILFDQRPLIYPQAYESAPRENQLDDIGQILEENREYLIYNPTIPAVDDTPEYLRNSSLFAFLMANYSPIESEGDYIIMRRSHEDVFAAKNLEQYPDLAKHLLSINLGHVPASEGYHKSGVLEGQELIGEFESVSELNERLAQTPIESEDVFVVLRVSDEADRTKSVVMSITEAQNSVETKVRFSLNAHTDIYILNLSRVPLFYRSRVISSVNTGEQDFEVIRLLRITDAGELW